MKTTIYMALSLDGKIARPDDSTGYISDDEWEKGFVPAAEQAGNLVVGRKTYEIMVKENSFNDFSPELPVIVVTSKTDYKTGKTCHIATSSPDDALAVLQKLDIKNAFICGGGGLISSFLKQEPVDSLYVDIEPVLIGKGIDLCSQLETDKKLKLIKTKMLSDNIIQLQYDFV